MLTNCPSNTSLSLIEKLKGMDIVIKKENVLTSGQVTASYLQRFPALHRVFLLGGDALRSELENRGLKIVEDDADCVVVGYDTKFNYEKMKKAVWMILNGAKFIATNNDLTIPFGNTIVPHTGALYMGIQAATDVKPIVMGKPERYMLDEAIKMLGCSKEELCMIGDNLHTDILFGKHFDINTYLVLTGVTSREDVEASEIKPDYIFNDLKEVYKYDKNQLCDN